MTWLILTAALPSLLICWSAAWIVRRADIASSRVIKNYFV
mgnify:CR=1 FL=1